jgi:hypothetical protein
MPQKHALLVGIDRYPHYTGELSCDLKGCVNDSELIKSLLLDKFDFHNENIQQLLNENATRSAILGGLAALVERAEQDDVVLFQYSGHGRLRYPPSQDLDEGSGHNSTLMPTDSGPAPVPNRDINDDEIQVWLQKLTQKTCNVTLIIDSCHSGSISRDAFGPKVRTIPPDDRAVAAAPADQPKANQPSAASTQAKGGSGWLEVSDRYVVISACADVEVASELVLTDAAGVDKSHGALTYYLQTALQQTQQSHTYRDIFEIAERDVSGYAAGLEPPRLQHPQIEGALDREIFGTKDIKPLRSILVDSVRGDTLVLSGGAAHGVLTNSFWAVYPPATKSEDQVDAIGLVKVQETFGSRSVATIVSGQKEIVIGSRCVLKDLAAEQQLLSVNCSVLPKPKQAAIAALVADSSFLQLSNDRSDAGVKVALVPELPRNLPEVDSNTLGELPGWPKSLSEIEMTLVPNEQAHEESDAELLADLEAMGRFRESLLLASPTEAVAVSFEVMRISEQGDAVAGSEAVPMYSLDEMLAFKVVNNQSVAIYFSILHMKLSGEIKLLYPPNAFSERIEPGKTVILGVDRTTRLVMDETDREWGYETFKLMVSTQQCQFAWLEQPKPKADVYWQPRNVGGEVSDKVEPQPMLPNSAQDNDDRWQAINRTIGLRRSS